jgi:hypothetical protein
LPLGSLSFLAVQIYKEHTLTEQGYKTIEDKLCRELETVALTSLGQLILDLTYIGDIVSKKRTHKNERLKLAFCRKASELINALKQEGILVK